MKFLADDGTIFYTLSQCEDYENSMKMKDANIENSIFFFKETDTSDGIERIDDPCMADYVSIENEIDYKVIEQLFDTFNCYSDGLECGKGVYSWNNEEEKWEKLSQVIENLESEISSLILKSDKYNEIADRIFDKINSINS